MQTRANFSEDKEQRAEEQQQLLDQPKITDEGATAAAKKKKKIIIGVVVALVIVGVALAIALPLALSSKGGGDNPPEPKSPEVQEFNKYEQQIDSHSDFAEEGTLTISDVSIANQYIHNAFKDERDQLVTNIYYRPVNPADIVNNENNKWAKRVSYRVSLIDTSTAKLVMYDKDAAPQNFPVLDDMFVRPKDTIEARFSQIGFTTSAKPFGFSFNNTHTKHGILSTTKRKLLLSPKFSEIGFTLPNQRLYGLGQHNAQFELKNGTYTLYARGRKETLPQDQALGGTSGNHIHPFLLFQTEDKDYAGIFFVSTSAQAFEIIQFPGYDQRVLNYITIGGYIEIYFFIGGTPNEIIAKYHNIIGKSQMPPYYALGVEQGTWRDSVGVKKLIADSAALSLEGFHIYNYNDVGDLFNVANATDYKNVNLGLKTQMQTFSMGIQAWYKNDPAIFAKKQADQLQCNVQSTKYSNPALIGKINNVEVNYPDFFCDKISDFLIAGASNLFTLVGDTDAMDVQGLEFTNSINGELDPQKAQPRQLFTVSEESIGQEPTYLLQPSITPGSFYDIPFTPGYNNSGYLDTQTISPNASRNGYPTKGGLIEYYIHNGNAHLALKKMKTLAEKQQKKRAAYLTSTSWAGTGQYAIGLITNLDRDWGMMNSTIQMAYGLSMYGFSNIMVDVCGTKGKMLDAEYLCGRWMQLAAFLPMARIYYSQDSDSNELAYYSYENQVMMTSSLQEKLKYSLYVYSEMYKVSQKGGAIVRPLFFDYPDDEKLLWDTNTTFMLGESLMVAPLLTNTAEYFAQFPKGTWANIHENSEIIVVTESKNITLKPKNTHANVFLKQGRIVPYQQNTKLIKTTNDFRTQLFTSLMINRDQDLTAFGTILIDDGISPNSYQDGKYVNWKIRHASKSISFWVESGDSDYQAPGGTQDILEEIKILNAKDLMETDFACYLTPYFEVRPLIFSVRTDENVLSLKPQNGQQLRFKDIKVIKYGSSSSEANICASSFGYVVTGSSFNDTTQNLILTLDSFNKDRFAPRLQAEIQLLNDDGSLHIQIHTENDDSYIPEDVYNPSRRPTLTKTLDRFFSYDSSPQPFAFKIFKESNPDAILYQSDPNLLFVSKYFVIDRGIFKLNPNTNNPFMGLGERAGSFFFEDQTNGVHTSNAYDQPNPKDDGKPPGKNIYGSQPFYAYQSIYKDFVGVFNLNPYAQDFILNKNNPAFQSVANIMTGGRINKFFFTAPSIEKLTVKYQGIVGTPALTPLWSFGWHQCRYGYVSGEAWNDVIQSYVSNNLPLDAMWADIDYLDAYKIFTLSPAYSMLPKYVDDAKTQHNIHFVPILDPGVALDTDPNYLALSSGLEQNVFIKAPTGDPLIGGAWPGKALFPDYTHPNTTIWWHQMLDYMHDSLGLKFDGIWLDENEVTNDCNGYCDSSQRPASDSKNLPIYVPGSRELDSKALGLDAKHYNGRTEYDLHNMYGYHQVRVTREYFLQRNKIPYVLSRANFAGMGKYGHHWLGDNWSNEEYLALSVHQMYTYSLQGLPFVGSDICGFDSFATTVEEIAVVCTRWHQLGALYPFARNHNQNGTVPHEPYRFKDIKIPGSTKTYFESSNTSQSMVEASSNLLPLSGPMTPMPIFKSRTISCQAMPQNYPFKPPLSNKHQLIITSLKVVGVLYILH